MPAIHQAVLACDQQPSLCMQQRFAYNTLGLIHHAPAQMVYRAMESRIMMMIVNDDDDSQY